MMNRDDVKFIEKEIVYGRYEVDLIKADFDWFYTVMVIDLRTYRLKGFKQYEELEQAYDFYKGIINHIKS